MRILSSHDPKAFHDFEHRGWEVVSHGYQEHFARLTCQSASALLNAAQVAQGVRVLDACCGPGMLAAEAVRQGATPVGLDFSEAFLAIARDRVPGVAFQRGDAQALDFEDESFDAVVCGFGVIHLPEPARALSEFQRVVRRGGRVALSTWEAPKPSNGFGLLYGTIKTHGNMNVPVPHGPDFFQFSHADSMTCALVDSGLTDVRVFTVDQTWDLDDHDGLLTVMLEGAVRARALLQAQSRGKSRAIRAALRSGMKRFKTRDKRYRVPMPALIGVGRK
jgi:SAM-dependent methyltransferase